MQPVPDLDLGGGHTHVGQSIENPDGAFAILQMDQQSHHELGFKTEFRPPHTPWVSNHHAGQNILDHIQKLFLILYPQPQAIFSLHLHPGFQTARVTCQCLSKVPFLLFPGEAFMGSPTDHYALLQELLYPFEPRPKTTTAITCTSHDIKLFYLPQHGSY